MELLLVHHLYLQVKIRLDEKKFGLVYVLGYLNFRPLVSYVEYVAFNATVIDLFDIAREEPLRDCLLICIKSHRSLALFSLLTCYIE